MKTLFCIVFTAYKFFHCFYRRLGAQSTIKAEQIFRKVYIWIELVFSILQYGKLIWKKEKYLNTKFCMSPNQFRSICKEVCCMNIILNVSYVHNILLTKWDRSFLPKNNYVYLLLDYTTQYIISYLQFLFFEWCLKSFIL